MTSSDSRSDERAASDDRPPAPALTEAERIHAAVLGCADVAGVSAGAFGEVASYLPGRTVSGIRLDADKVEVHVVARYGEPLQAIADQVGGAVAPWLAGRRLLVAVEDILLPGEVLDDGPTAVLDDGPTAVLDAAAVDAPVDLPPSPS